MGGPNKTDPDDSGFGDFDYDAFEEELVEDPPTDPSFAVLPTEDPEPEGDRRTFDRRLVPKGDAAFSARTLGPYKVVSIRGRMNESFPADDVQKELRGPAVLDLRDVDRVSSFGVRGWLTMLQKAQSPEIYLSHCSDAIVNQITMMRNFCGDAKIHSFLAPYACESCGADFGVRYHAIEDRQRIEARRPVEVPCPECGEATEMDEDPFTYFDLVDHLLVEAPIELERAIASLDENKRAPVEIELDGERTAVRFNQALTGATRFARVFNSVEGALTVDLRTAPSVEIEAVAALVEALSRLDSAVTDVHVEGSPDALTRLLIQRKVARVQIRSLLTPVEDLLGGKTRPAVIDLQQHGPDLAAGRALSLPLPWAKGQVKPVDQALVSQVLNAPLQKSLTTPPAPTLTPTANPSPLGTTAKLAAVPMLVGGFLLVAALLGLSAVAFMSARSPPPEPAPAPEPIVVPVPSDVWTTGGSLPPAWAELPIATTDGILSVVGRGTGADPEAAGLSARSAAYVAITRQIEEQLQESSAAAGLSSFDGLNHKALTENLSSLHLLRSKQAVKVGDPVEVLARYSVPSARFDAYLATLQQTQSFKGIVVALNPPWRAKGLRLVTFRSWFAGVEAGDSVVRVGQKPVIDLASFAQETDAAWRGLVAGASLTITVLRDGEEQTLWVRRPPKVVRPVPPPVGVGPHPFTTPEPLPLND